MAIQFANNTFARLAAPMDAVGTSLLVETGQGAQFPTLATGDYFYLTLVEVVNGQETEYEIVKVTSRAIDALTVERGQDNTTARSWSIGTRCEMRNNAQVFRDLGDPVATEFEMQAGVVTEPKRVSPALVKAAIDANASSTLHYSYEDRGELRLLTPANKDMALVEGLGLFVFYTGSTEPDDDESCFATATGKWVLEAVHWDVVDTWQLPDDEARDAFDEDEGGRFQTSFQTSFQTRVLYGSANCNITSITASGWASFSGSVVGASIGDRVVATPPDILGQNTNSSEARLAYHTYVTAPDIVTITLTNPTTGTATINPTVQTYWPITVIKEI